MFKKIYNSSIFTSWISQVVKVVFGLITLPIVLKKFSIEETNLWFPFTTIVGIGQGIQYGFNSTFVRYFSYSYSGVNVKDFFKIKDRVSISSSGNVNESEFSDLLIVMKKTFLILTILYFILVLFLGTLSILKPVNYLENRYEGWIAWGLIIFGTTFNIYMTIYQIYLRGINKVALINRVSTIVSFFGVFLVLYVGIFFARLITIVFVVELIAIINSISIYFLSRKVNNNFLIELPKSKFKKEVFVVVWDSAWKSGITTIFATIIKHVSGIIVAQLFNPVTSASFLLTKRIFELLESFMMVTFQAKVPEIASLRAIGDFKRLIPLLYKVLYLLYGIFIMGVFIILFFGENLILLIKGNTDLGDVNLLIAFTFSTLILRWAGINLSISNQANHVIEHINGFIVFVCYFLFLGVFYKQLGVIVFPLAILFATLVTSPLIIRGTYKTLHTTFFEFEKRIFIPTICIVSLICFVKFLMS